jgi:hypothetical protein
MMKRAFALLLLGVLALFVRSWLHYHPNAAHADHLHLDQAPRGLGGFCR